MNRCVIWTTTTAWKLVMPKKCKSQSAQAFKSPIPKFWGQSTCDGEYFWPKELDWWKGLWKQCYYKFCQSFPSNISSLEQNYVKFGTAMLKLKIFGRRSLILKDVTTQMCMPLQRFNCNKQIKFEHWAHSSIFTNANRCLSMKHTRMELMSIIGANNKNLNYVDRSEIIKTTLNIYLKNKKRRN